VIYEEYWDRPRITRITRIKTRFIRVIRVIRGPEPLSHLYSSEDAFLRDVPRLIIEHNLHGIDIDPRCVQIAGPLLWLRAQKS
jgi:hypothetical protein